MNYISEFVGSLIFLLGGYSYMCNATLKKTLIANLNYIELVMAWSLSVGFGLAVAVAMGGPAYLNPGVVLGNIIMNSLSIKEGLLYILMEFIAAGAAVMLTYYFFKDAFEAEPETSKRGIFAAYPAHKDLARNYLQEIVATFVFLFILFVSIKSISGPVVIGAVGAMAVAFMSLTLNSTGFSMNAMRSVFSSFWFTILPISYKYDRVDWKYQIWVNLFGSTLGGALATIVAALI